MLTIEVTKNKSNPKPYSVTCKKLGIHTHEAAAIEDSSKGMSQQGIPVVKINYEELGNWAYKPNGGHAFLHMHVFGRASNAVKQPFPEAVFLPG